MNILSRASVARGVDGLCVGGGVAGDLELVLRFLEVLAQVRRYPMQNELVLRETCGQTPRALDSAVVLRVTARLCQPALGSVRASQAFLGCLILDTGVKKDGSVLLQRGHQVQVEKSFNTTNKSHVCVCV